MTDRKKILLHVCCGPCATASIERLLEDDWSIDLYYSNSNISPPEEYAKRLDGVIKTADYFGLNWIEDKRDHDAWLKSVEGLENEPERGARCAACFTYSLGRAAAFSAAEAYDGYTTSLSISPHKDSMLLFDIGKAAGNFIEYNFKKRDGYRRSIALAKEIGLYRQNYCGCEFSIRD